MKKWMIGMIAAALMASLSACGGTEKKPDMYIEKARLSTQEENIVKLLGGDTLVPIYDFKVDQTLKSIQINTYELEHGEWKRISGGGGHAFADKEGRLALGFENLSEDLRVAIQGENSSGSVKHSTEEKEKFEGSRSESILNDRKEIVYEQEIPLAVQIFTTQNSISSYQVDCFFEPEKYEDQGYEHVYALTVRFSQKTLNELDMER